MPPQFYTAQRLWVKHTTWADCTVSMLPSGRPDEEDLDHDECRQARRHRPHRTARGLPVGLFPQNQPGFQSLQHTGEDEAEAGERDEPEEELLGPPEENPPERLVCFESEPSARKALPRDREKSSIDHMVTAPKREGAQVRELKRVAKELWLCSRLTVFYPGSSTTCGVKKQRSRHELENETACRHIRSTRGQAAGFRPPRDRAEARKRRATPARRRPDLL